jgi:acetyl esterase/lipase
MIIGLIRGLQSWFRPTIDGLTTWHLPWAVRWRLLAFQPGVLFTYSIESYRYLFYRPFKVEWLPIAPGRTLRALVFDDPYQKDASTKRGKLRPLHLDIHGGSFIGGLPEGDGPYCERIAQETGAVVISTSYRYAPRHPFPGAIDDIDAVVKYLQENAKEKWGADPELMTVSGSSAGGNLAFALTQQPNCQPPAKTSVKGIVTFYAAVSSL